MQRLAKMLVGKWKVDEDFVPGGTLPNGGKGSGHSVIELGPGGSSLIEGFVSSSPAGRWHSLICWEKAGKVFRTVGCDDFSEGACPLKMDEGVGKATKWCGNLQCPRMAKPYLQKSFGQKRASARDRAKMPRAKL